MITPNTSALLTSLSSLELIVIASNCCFCLLVDNHFFALVSILLELVDIRQLLDIGNNILDEGFTIPWNNFS
jgi:hypothetical protein